MYMGIQLILIEKVLIFVQKNSLQKVLFSYWYFCVYWTIVAFVLVLKSWDIAGRQYLTCHEKFASSKTKIVEEIFSSQEC